MNERRNFLKAIVAAVGAWFAPKPEPVYGIVWREIPFKPHPAPFIDLKPNKLRPAKVHQYEMAWYSGDLDAMGGLSK